MIRIHGGKVVFLHSYTTYMTGRKRVVCEYSSALYIEYIKIFIIITIKASNSRIFMADQPA